jgi:hypothetical protein
LRAFAFYSNFRFAGKHDHLLLSLMVLTSTTLKLRRRFLRKHIVLEKAQHTYCSGSQHAVLQQHRHHEAGYRCVRCPTSLDWIPIPTAKARRQRSDSVAWCSSGQLSFFFRMTPGPRSGRCVPLLINCACPQPAESRD